MSQRTNEMEKVKLPFVIKGKYMYHIHIPEFLSFGSKEATLDELIDGTFVSSNDDVFLSPFASGLLSVDEELLLLFMLTSTITPFDCGTASGGVVVVVMAVFCKSSREM